MGTPMGRRGQHSRTAGWHGDDADKRDKLVAMPATSGECDGSAWARELGQRVILGRRVRTEKKEGDAEVRAEGRC